jgi:glycosyltransferase involved in cell wall biosynthesis
MKISIAMATYNGGKYLREQLDSFLAQTRLPDELVITDDCSTDDTLAIIETFAATAPFEVRWERNEHNLGYTGNFNKALMKAVGDLVFLSDQDDVWFPEKLERMERYALEDPEALVVMNDAALTDGDLNDTGLTKLGQIVCAGMTDSSFVMGCCAAVRRELLDLCLPIPAGYKGHDNWIVKMAEGVGRKRVFADVLQWYRRHNENESQFIANRTTKVNRRHAFLNSSKRLLQGDNRQQDQEQLAQQHLMIDGIQRVLSVAPEKYQSGLQSMLETKKANARSFKMRADVRATSLVPRIFATFWLVCRGEYRSSRGFKSVLRDLVGL